jgi:hypothetical protein
MRVTKLERQLLTMRGLRGSNGDGHAMKIWLVINMEVKRQWQSLVCSRGEPVQSLPWSTKANMTVNGEIVCVQENDGKGGGQEHDRAVAAIRLAEGQSVKKI